MCNQHTVIVGAEFDWASSRQVALVRAKSWRHHDVIQARSGGVTADVTAARVGLGVQVGASAHSAGLCGGEPAQDGATARRWVCRLRQSVFHTPHVLASSYVSFSSVTSPLCTSHPQKTTSLVFTRDSIYTAVARLSHCNSVCSYVRLSHGWISQKRCKLGPPNLHHRLPERL